MSQKMSPEERIAKMQQARKDAKAKAEAERKQHIDNLTAKAKAELGDKATDEAVKDKVDHTLAVESALGDLNKNRKDYEEAIIKYSKLSSAKDKDNKLKLTKQQIKEIENVLSE